MALSVAQFAQVSNRFSLTANGGNKTVTGLAWSSGDIIVVIGGGEVCQSGGQNITLSTPTNANLTFSLAASVTAGGSAESSCYVWTATAGSSQSSQTVTSVINTGTAGSFTHGVGVWVVTGSPTGVANATANNTETAFSKTVAAGSVVVFGLNDWNATNPPGKTPLAGGGGTTTERRDVGDGGHYGQYMYDEVGTSSGTFSLGPSNYTSLKVAQCVIEVTAPGGGTDATASPAAIARSFTVPAVTAGASHTASPAQIARAVTIPAPTVTGGTTASPAAIARAVALPAPTVTATSTASPAAIARAVTVPAVTATAASTASPAAIARAVTIPAVTVTAGADITPNTIARTITIPAVTASGAGNATASPNVIARTITIPAVTATGAGNATATPAATSLTITIPAVTATGVQNATASPAVVVTITSIPAVTASGTGAGTATPATIARTFTVPAVTPTATSTASPGTITLVSTIPGVTAGVSDTVTPNVIARTITIPAVTASGAGNATSSPATIVLTLLIPAVNATGNVIIEVSLERTFMVRAESRTMTVAAESRTYLVRADVRPHRGASMTNINAYIHDPNAVLDYTVDWSDWLVGADTITSRVVTAPAGITKNSDSFTTTTVTAWMTGGTVGQTYDIVYHVTTVNGRQDDRTISLRVQER